MSIALVAFDLDGTTLTEHKYLSSANREALEAAAAKGVILVPASGRMKDFLPQEIIQLPGVRYAITANGAGVYDLKEGRTVWQCLIPNKKAKAVQALLDEYDLFVEYYHQGRSITCKGYPQRAKTDFGFPKEKFHFLSKDYVLAENLGSMLDETNLEPEKINLPYLATDQLRKEVWQRIEGLGGLHLTSSIPDNIEVNVLGADKGNALRALAQKLGVGQEEIMALGDNGNDVTMLEYAGISVAMGDGSQEAKAAAKYVTVPHTQDGLAKALEQFVLG